MRIVHAIDSAGLYGAEAVLLNLAQEQQRAGHEPTVLSIGRTGAPEKALEGRARSLGLPCIPHRMRDGLNLPGGRDILRIAEQTGADVIHSHGYKPDILLALTMPRRGARPAMVATLHGWTAKSPFSKLGIYRFLDQQLLSRFDALVIVSEGMRTLRAIRRLPAPRLFTVPNGIPLSERPAAAPDDALAKQIGDLRGKLDAVFAVVGRLSPEKNVRIALEALLAPANRNIGLAVLGDGPDAARLREMVATRGLSDRVFLAGYVENAPRYLSLVDGLLLPSLTEGLPMILLEAMLANLPIIATRVGDVPRTLGDLGTLVEPGDLSALTDAIGYVAAHLPEFRARAASGARRVLEHFSASAMASAYERVYRAARNDSSP